MVMIDGKLVANKLKINLKKRVQKLGFTPELVIVQIGDEFASNKYIKNKTKIGVEIGVNCRLFKLRPYISQHELETLMYKLTKDIKINGIIVQLPIPRNFNTEKILNIISFNKDVDGLGEVNQNKLLEWQEPIIPATPRGIITLMNYYKIDFLKMSVVIIGKGQLVGKPLGIILKNLGANVINLDSKSDNMLPIKTADILISAAGSPHLIKKDDIKNGAIIIDVGTTMVNNKLTGDVDFEDVKDKVSYITPTIGGVGPMTVISLFENLIDNLEKIE